MRKGRKLLSLLLAAVLCLSLLPLPILAEDLTIPPADTAETAADGTFGAVFPDAIFRDYVWDTVLSTSQDDKSYDSVITDAQWAAIRSWTGVAVGERDIASLAGIEHFTAMTTLNCSQNSLSTLDLSANTALQELYCDQNQLTELDLSHNVALQKLSCNRNQLTSLTVGITHTAESNAIAEALARYVNSRSGVTIKIITDSQSNLHDMLKNYELDFAIVEGKINDPSLKYLILDTDCLVLAVSPGHRLAHRGMVTIGELQKEKMILRLPDSGTRNLFVASLESQNLSIDDFNVVLEIDNIATIKDLIRRDFGVSVLAKSACMDELKKKKIVVLPIENLSMMREINIVYTQDFEHFQLLRDIVRYYNETRQAGAVPLRG